MFPCFRRYGFYRMISMRQAERVADMMDAKLLRENPDAMVTSLKRRGAVDKVKLVDDAVKADAEWRKLKTEVDRLRHRQNELTAEVATLKKKGESIDEKLSEVKDIPRKIKEADARADEVNARLAKILMSLPNILHESVPDGKDE